MVNKRRKPEEERSDVKRRRAEAGCDGAERGEPESKSTSGSELRPEEDQQSQGAEGPEEDKQSQSAEGVEEAAAAGEDEETGREKVRSPDCAMKRAKTPPTPQDPISSCGSEMQGCGAGPTVTSKSSPAEHSGTTAPRMQTPPDVIDITEESSGPPGVDSSQKAERRIPETGPISDSRSTECKPPLQDSRSEDAAPPSSAQERSAATPRVPNPAFPREPWTPHDQSSSPDIPRPKASPPPEPCVSKRDPSPGVRRRGCGPNGSGALQPEGSGAEPDEPHPVFRPVALRGSASEPPTSALQPFTVYRDPMLGRPQTEPSHVTYLHPQLHPLHQSPRSACLAPPTPHHPSHGLIHHPHLLPSMLPGLAPPSLLGAVGLAHHPHHQQPPSTAGPSYNHLGLYPIVWQYPALGLPSSKWGLPEGSVNSEPCLRRVRLLLQIFV